jgi:hypothetical protein
MTEGLKNIISTPIQVEVFWVVMSCVEADMEKGDSWKTEKLHLYVHFFCDYQLGKYLFI